MNKLKVLIFALILVISSLGITKADSPDNSLIKYYSASLSLNLNYAMEASKIIYQLSKEDNFNKNLLETISNKIKQNLDDANTDIANIILNTMGNKKDAIDKYLKNIDTHLAQASVDLKSIGNKLNNKEDVALVISDMYYQIKKAENEDHQQITKILKIKKLEAPSLVAPKK